tara:strand:- start:693 stop:881 length:189 start_codon:yes stop_codon:yes gene_type:complete
VLKVVDVETQIPLGQKNALQLGHVVHLLLNGVDRWQWVTTQVLGVLLVMILIEDGVTAIIRD